jgi:hypothetical protein
MIRGALRKQLGAGSGLQDIEKTARVQFLLREYQRNPEGAKKALRDSMGAYASNAKSFNAENLAEVRATGTQENTLLRGQIESEKSAARQAASKRAVEVKSLEHYYLRKANESRTEEEKQQWIKKAEELKMTAMTNQALAQGVRPAIEAGPDGSIVISKTPAVAPGVMQDGTGTPAKTQLPPDQRAALIKQLSGQEINGY